LLIKIVNHLYTLQDSAVINPDSIAKVYKVGDVIRSLRVLGYNLVEGWALGSNIQKVVEGLEYFPTAIL
jgi:hypothetical protein